jgi:hypothetical protein
VLFPWHTAMPWLWRVLFLAHSIPYTYKIRYFILTKNLSTSKLFLLSMYNIWYMILKFGMFCISSKFLTQVNFVVRVTQIIE